MEQVKPPKSAAESRASKAATDALHAAAAAEAEARATAGFGGQRSEYEDMYANYESMSRGTTPASAPGRRRRAGEAGEAGELEAAGRGDPGNEFLPDVTSVVTARATTPLKNSSRKSTPSSKTEKRGESGRESPSVARGDQSVKSTHSKTGTKISNKSGNSGTSLSSQDLESRVGMQLQLVDRGNDGGRAMSELGDEDGQQGDGGSEYNGSDQTDDDMEDDMEDELEVLLTDIEPDEARDGISPTSTQFIHSMLVLLRAAYKVRTGRNGRVCKESIVVILL